jgi:hypothetical protein
MLKSARENAEYSKGMLNSASSKDHTGKSGDARAKTVKKTPNKFFLGLRGKRLASRHIFSNFPGPSRAFQLLRVQLLSTATRRVLS